MTQHTSRKISTYRPSKYRKLNVQIINSYCVNL